MKKQDIIRNILIVFGLIAVMILAMLGYSYFIKTQLENEMQLTLEEISKQSAKIVQAEVKSHFTLMEEIALDLTIDGEFNLEKSIDELERKKANYPFKHIGISLPDGTGMLSDGRVIKISDNGTNRWMIERKTVVSELMNDKWGEGKIISYATPISVNGINKAVLFSMIDVNTFKKLLAVESFNGEGYAYIVRSTGAGVVDSEHPTSFELTNLFENMMEATYKNQKSVRRLQSDFNEGKSGVVVFRNKIDKYMYYMPLDINDWYLAHVVPENVLLLRMKDILQKTYIICAVLLVLFLAAAAYWFYYSKRRTEQINKILYTDSVTGGLSQAKFIYDATESLAETDRAAALISLDINNFKLINEIFGRDTGDVLLWFVHSCMQKVLPRTSIYARGMADRFCALVYYNSMDQLIECVSVLCEYIVKKAPERFEAFILKPCVGIYVIKNHQKNVQEMINAASFARASIKTGTHDKPYAFYTDAHRDRLLKNKQLADDLEVALRNNEFMPYFQPQYKASDKTICGAEALMRWQKSDGTIVSPGEFIPFAEKNGFISQLDENMFFMVCRYQRQLMDSGIRPVPVSVNVSRQFLYDNQFIDKYMGIMEQFSLPVELIELEITETALFENQDRFIDIIHKLREHGFKILMDDFGTGYSSLMMLKSIPIDVMKLDKTFVDDYDDEAGLHIIKCVTNLAKSLNISVIAEGVELEEQYKLLCDLKCDVIQGYYFSKPVPFDKYREMLENR